jgi:hypothetical protein
VRGTDEVGGSTISHTETEDEITYFERVIEQFIPQ